MNQPSLILTIGDVSVRVKSEDKQFLHNLEAYYSHFADRKSRDIAADIQLTHQTLSFKESIAVTSDEDSYIIDGGEFKGEFSLISKKAFFTMRAEVSLFNSFLRVFYSIILTRHDSFLVHAAGLKKGDQAYLFAGPSESGKTTTASIADNFTVLNDELVLVKRKGSEFYLYATPFNGDYDNPIENCFAPLKGFFFLDKQLQAGFEPIDPIQCLIRLLESVFFFDSNLEPNQRILDLCHQLAAQFHGFKINILSREHLGELINDISSEYSYT